MGTQRRNWIPRWQLYNSREERQRGGGKKGKKKKLTQPTRKGTTG
jgi:hypothetical protein